MTRRIGIGVCVAALVLALVTWGGSRLMKAVSPASTSRLPVTQVRRGDVTITVSAKGELSGGHTEMLSAPMAGGGDMAITYLREAGEPVAAGDVVVKFDTTEQEFKLKEAEADLAEAEQHVIQTQADNQAKEEETRYALVQAKTDVRTTELDARRNPILADIVARENTLALEAAKDHMRQLEHDAANRQATSAAAVAIQEAARNKAKVQAETARQNIENMVLKAKTGGYVSVMLNTNCNMCMFGMQRHARQPVIELFRLGTYPPPGPPNNHGRAPQRSHQIKERQRSRRARAGGLALGGRLHHPRPAGRPQVQRRHPPADLPEASLRCFRRRVGSPRPRFRRPRHRRQTRPPRPQTGPLLHSRKSPLAQDRHHHRTGPIPDRRRPLRRPREPPLFRGCRRD